MYLLKTKNSEKMFPLKTKNYRLKTNSGFIAISTTLIISVVVIAIATTVTMLSINEAQSSLALTKGEETLGFVEGCVEDVLLKSQADIDYAGGTITRPEGTCTAAISKNGTTWTATVTTADIKYKKTTEAIYSRTTQISITSWREI